MKYPMINKQPRREVNIPELSGGLNLRDSMTGIRDNQMTDCVNMWYKDGMLKTRPSFNTNDSCINMSGRLNDNENLDTKFHNDVKVFYKGHSCICATNKRVITDDNGNVSCDIEFEFQSLEKTFIMPTIKGIDDGENITYFCVEMSGVLYCYVSNFSIWKLEYETLSNGEEPLEWSKVSKNNTYIPTVYAHCKRTGWDDFDGVQFEGYNLISDSYKMIYSAYNELDSDKSHPMRYVLGQELAESGEIRVEITSYNASEEKVNTVIHSITYTKEQYQKIKEGQILIEKFENDKLPEDKLYLFVKYNYVGFLFEDKGNDSFVAMLDTAEKVSKYGLNEDNIIITAPLKMTDDNLKKVFCMTQSIWFGGAANGINSGSRLFLCGNTNNSEKSLVIWSGRNEPLYFSENSYAYVGRKSRAVTAFGKQGENLIVFKENKIYSTYYAQNDNITADNVINQSVIDYEAQSIYFPMIQINAFIGCDCPDTIQMCRNRLVWANSEGKIFTLANLNQYNEHTVYEASEMVAPKIKMYRDKLKNATSADAYGHYILFLGDCALVMNYSCYGYQYIYSYSKSEDANVMIPWYYWDFSFLKSNTQKEKYQNAVICALDGEIVMRAYFDAVKDNNAGFVGFTMNDNENVSADKAFYTDLQDAELKICDSVINSSITTKLFELGNGIYNINVDSVAVKLGLGQESDANINFITDYGAESEFVENSGYSDNTAMMLIRSIRIRPCIRSILRFGIQIKCKGYAFIDGLSIKYRLLGGNN